MNLKDLGNEDSSNRTLYCSHHSSTERSPVCSSNPFVTLKTTDGSNHLLTHVHALLPITATGRAPAKRSSIFSGFNMVAMLDDELDANKTKSQGPPPSAMLRNPSGRIVTKQGVAHQVISDDVQWRKLQAQMREKGAVSGMMLKQNLNGLLQDRAKELPSQRKSSASRDSSGNGRRTSYIADFATSLILGEGDPKDEPQRRRMSMPGQGFNRKMSPMPVLGDAQRSRFSALFTEASTSNNIEEPKITLRRSSHQGPSLAPSLHTSRTITSQYEKPEKKASKRDSSTSFSSISSIHEANDSENDEDDDGKNHSAIVSTSQSMRNSTDDMLNPNQSVRNMNRSDRSTTRGTEVQW